MKRLLSLLILFSSTNSLAEYSKCARAIEEQPFSLGQLLDHNHSGFDKPMGELTYDFWMQTRAAVRRVASAPRGQLERFRDDSRVNTRNFSDLLILVRFLELRLGEVAVPSNTALAQYATVLVEDDEQSNSKARSMATGAQESRQLSSYDARKDRETAPRREALNDRNTNGLNWSFIRRHQFSNLNRFSAANPVYLSRHELNNFELIRQVVGILYRLVDFAALDESDQRVFELSQPWLHFRVTPTRSYGVFRWLGPKNKASSLFRTTTDAIQDIEIPRGWYIKRVDFSVLR